MTVHLHEGDLPADLFAPGATLAVDSETLGLNPLRDRLCLLQIADGGGDEHLVRFGHDRPDRPDRYAAPNLRAVLADPARLKLFHFARFDVAVIEQYLGVIARPLFCTKIASRLVRTYTDRHGLKDLVKELLAIDISKAQQSSDWGAAVLSDAQKEYAASDVRYLHRMHTILIDRLARDGRADVAQAMFDFLPWRARLDLLGWPETDLFAHA
jgi:ribonuclease D